MSFRTVFILILAGFVVLCAGLIVDSGFLGTMSSPVPARAASAEAPTPGQGAILLQQTTEVAPPTPGPGTVEPNAPAPVPQLAAPAGGSLGAEGGPRQEVTLGATDKASGFKYLLTLDSLGAALRSTTFSEYDTRDGKTREPLVFLTPVQVNGRTVLSLANGALTMMNQRQRLRLDQLSWRSLGVEKLPEGGEAASWRGRVIAKRVTPAAQCALISPPCARTIERVIASPSPAPSPWRARWVLPRWKRSKMRSS